ncbi:hypothetical protein NM688_g339 [Phlebia brevispora]|uniref:Uncharacterized protein n=1 Tax=Phlebia brevispora TaxID=194682 RepID=A0ACC1TEA5_9APHY|nr:hypothetical protein NM688_g339 [Phlebia brevispora]
MGNSLLLTPLAVVALTTPTTPWDVDRGSRKMSQERKPRSVKPGTLTDSKSPQWLRALAHRILTTVNPLHAEPQVPWPRVESEEEVQEDWRGYCDRRHQECCQHAMALEYLLSKYPEQRAWLEKHGFDTQELIESLRWYPSEELENLEKAKSSARDVERDKLRKCTSQNYDRMQENLLRLLPLVREVQDELESASTQAAPVLTRTKIPRSGSKLAPPKAHSTYSTIQPIGSQWKEGEDCEKVMEEAVKGAKRERKDIASTIIRVPQVIVMADTAACRILVVSSTTAQAQQFVQRVMAISSPADIPSVHDDDSSLTNATDAHSSSIPWTIANKYYTADVHFETREYKTFVGYHASEVPAVIYVWGRGDLKPYKEHVPALADKLQHYDPEVSLAVRFPSKEQALPYEKDEEDGLDDFLSSHGFERTAQVYLLFPSVVYVH